MKKNLSIIIIGFLMLMLTACNITANPSGNVDKGGKETSGKDSNLTLQEVFDKTIKASGDLDSFSLNMKMDQEMGDGVDTFAVKMDINMDIINKPMSLYQKMNMSMDSAIGENATVESYFTEDGFFLYDETSDQWFKMPQEMLDEVMQLSEEQADPNQQLKQLQKFVDDFTFEQDDSNYILHLVASGNDFLNLIKEMSFDMIDESIPEGEDLWEGISIDKLEYTIFVDKKTFLPTKIDMDMNMEMNIDGQVLHVKQKANGNYSNLNAVDPIIVPANVLDSAVEIEM